MNLARFARSRMNMALFWAGLRPKVFINKDKCPVSFIPEGYRSVCLISADFEMAWASRYTKSTQEPLQKAIKDGIQTRKNVPIILDLCDTYNIPITWASVGHLFLESCQQINGVKHPDIPRLPYFENEFWKFDKGDWFDYDPCTDYDTDPAWYAPDLIRDILGRKTKHEIGCHTFSHIDCSDEINSREVFIAEINKCQDIASNWGLVLKSFVHPGHTIGNLSELKEKGFRSIRTDYGDRLAPPTYRPEGVWEFHNTAILDLRKEWSIEYQISRYRRIIDRAIKHGMVCVLWFHPSFPTRYVRDVLPKVLSYVDEKRNSIIAMTHEEYSKYLDVNYSTLRSDVQ